MRVDRLLRDARRQLDALDVVAGDEAALAAHAPDVSAWSVAQHVEHLAEADVLCLRAAALLLQGGDERIVPSGSPTLMGRLLLATGHIPRGKGRAPEPTVPREAPDMAVVRERLVEGRDVLDALSRDPAGIGRAPGRVPHPLLGDFSAAQWLRFTAVHVRHHLAIVADVRRRT